MCTVGWIHRLLTSATTSKQPRPVSPRRGFASVTDKITATIDGVSTTYTKPDAPGDWTVIGFTSGKMNPGCLLGRIRYISESQEYEVTSPLSLDIPPWAFPSVTEVKRSCNQAYGRTGVEYGYVGATVRIAASHKVYSFSMPEGWEPPTD